MRLSVDCTQRRNGFEGLRQAPLRNSSTRLRPRLSYWYVPPLEKLIDKRKDTQALVPDHAMPIEPPAMHPRVASQEGRFVMFGKVLDLLEEEILLEPLSHDTAIEELRVEQITIKLADVDDLMQDLAQLGVSRRTLFPDLTGLADFINWKHFHKVRGYKL
jgi:hypothetical protein